MIQQYSRSPVRKCFALHGFSSQFVLHLIKFGSLTSFLRCACLSDSGPPDADPNESKESCGFLVLADPFSIIIIYC